MTVKDGQTDQVAYEKKVEEIADRIWKMMQKELRDDLERRGKDRR